MNTCFKATVIGMLMFMFMALMIQNASAQTSKTFVIDPSGKGDFTTVTAAVASLSTGISLPTIFIVKAGTYSGRISISPVTGASSTNTISFIGVSRDSVTITFAGTTAANRATLLLNGADYVTFKNIRFANTGATYATAVCLTAQADYNTFDNCDMRIDSTSTSTTANTFCNILCSSSEATDAGYGNAGNYNTIQNCRINGGNYGVKFNGTSATVTCANNYILKNILHSQYTNGIYFYYQNGARIENNYLYNVRNTAAYGISSWSSNNTRVIGNNVHAGEFGVYFDTEKNATGISSIINNMISDVTYSSQYGIYLKNACTYVDILHNSVIVSGSAASTTCGGIVLADASTTIRILNNNLMSFGAFACLTIASTAVINPGDCDYNNLYNSTAASISYWKSAQFTDINYLKNFDLNYNQNSVQLTNEFVSNTDLHLILTATGRFAKPISTVTTDIDGNTRCLVSATIGADEIGKYPTSKPIVSYTSADTVNLYTAVTFTNIAMAGEAKRHSWYVNNIFESNDLNLIKVFRADSTYFVKLVTENCFGSDSFGKVIKTRTPSVASKTFVIDALGTGDFLTFTAAIASLSTGITTPVVFIVKPGTYTERISISPVTGASAINTITFAGLNKYTCILTFAGTSTSNRATVVMNGADYIKFRNLKIMSTGTSYGMTFFYTGQADYNSIEDCILWVLPTITSDNVENVIYNSAESSVTGYANNGNYNLIQNCRLVGGNYGVRLNGTSTTVACLGNIIQNNDFDNQYTYGVYNYFENGTRIENNYFHNVRSATSYGIYGASSCGSSILRNNIHAQQYGIYLSSENRYIAGYTLVANNMISDLIASSHYGIYLTALNTTVDIVHNSVIVSGAATSTTCAAICVVDGSGNRILNNNLMSFGYYPCLNIAAAASFAPGAIDFNDLFNSTNGSIAYWISADFPKLVNLKRINASENQNSYQANPVFVSNSNLHLGATAVGRFGKPITGVTTDMDGDIRCIFYATIGADEYNKPCNSSAVDVSAGSIISALTVKNNSLTITFTSTKIDTIRKLSFGYQVDNNTPVLEPNIMLAKPIGIFNSGSYKFSTILNFPAKGTYNLKYWVNTPNGVADADISNDTVSLTVYICDTFIIDQAGKGDFTTFTTAINTVLKSTTGIFGPVVFLVKTGTYNERITLTEVMGASAINTITFIGISKDSVTLSFTGTSTSNRATVVMSGGDYYRFKKLTVMSPAAFGMTFFFTGQADNNIIDGCNLTVSTSVTVADVTNVLASASESSATTYGNSANNNLIQNCSFKGGFYGAIFTGTSNTVTCANNYILNNDFNNQYSYGIYFYYENGTRIENNFINNMMNTSSYGISLWSSNNSKVNANKVQAHRNGIDINSENRYVTGNSLISNNMICDLTNMYQYGINLTALCTGVDVFHNSIVVTSGPVPTGGMSISGSVITFIQSTGAGIWINDGSKNRVFNNNLLQMGGYPCIDWEAAATFNPGDIDYNVMYNLSGGSIAIWKGSVFIDLSQLKKYDLLFNQNSIQANPGYISNLNLHLSSSATGNFGLNTLGITTDLDGDIRCKIAPTIGADEFNHPAIKPVAGFKSADTVIMYSPYTFLNNAKQGEPKKHWWYINGSFITNNLNMTHTFTSPSKPVISLKTSNCYSSDSTSKTIVIDSPRVVPIAEFLTSKYVLDVFDSTVLNDLSLNYPSSWQWKISPDSILDTILGFKMPAFQVRNGNLTVQNPKIQFLYSGSYSVSLKATNSKGSGIVNLKTNYIEVVEPNMLCTWPMSSQANSGTLYDGGGPIGNYTKGTNCFFMINPCAGAVTLRFTDIDIKSVDYLRIYDGKDNTGIPLWDLRTFGNYGINNVTWGDPKFNVSYTANSGSLYLEFTTDPRTVGNPLGRGFSTQWTSAPGSFARPNAIFTAPDSVCLGRSVEFINKTIGDRLTYEWDFESDNVIDDISTNPAYVYSTSGLFKATMYATNCGGSDTFFKLIKVYTPVTNPVLAFSADNRIPAKDIDIVTFTDESVGCTDYWLWKITPLTYSIVNYSLTSPFVGVIFHDTGCYNVTMISGYGSGSDSVVKKCYIRPVNICTPSVTNLEPDIAINRVTIGSIDNPSGLSSSGYSDYTKQFSTTVQKGGNATITIFRSTIRNSMNRKIWIDWNIDGDFNDAGEMVAMEPPANTNSWTTTFGIPKNAVSGSTRMRIGVSLANQPNTACGTNNFGEFEDYRIIITNDNVIPVITLKGNPVVNIEQCKNYLDAGASANDNVDGNITANIKTTGIVNTSLVGSYTIYYNVSDSSGNKAVEVTRTVNVTKDVSSPVLTLNGKSIDSVQACYPWSDPGYISYDSCSGLDTVVVIGKVNTSVTGTYKINYGALDQSGNSIVVTRTVVVTPDINPPVLTLKGNPLYNLQVFSSWADPGYTSSDSCSGLDYVSVTGLVDTSNVGLYKITYTAFDLAGNSAKLFRTVTISDTIAPVITTTTPDTIIEDVNFPLNLPSMKITDNYYKNLTPAVSGTFYTAFPGGTGTILGNYTLIYTVTDGSNNKSSIGFVVKVVDRIMPEIKLVGQALVQIFRYTTLKPVDDSVIVTDNYDPSPVLNKTGSYFTDYLVNRGLGVFDILYTAIDQSGNSRSIYRYVNVVTGISGISDDNNGLNFSIYPNPNQGRFTIEFKQNIKTPVQIRIINNVGKTIFTESMTKPDQKNLEIDLSSVASGIYFLQIQEGKMQNIQRISIVR